MILVAGAGPAAAQREPAAKPEAACADAPPGGYVPCKLRRLRPAPPPPVAAVAPSAPACHWHLPGRLPGYTPDFSVAGGFPSPDGRTTAVPANQPDGTVVHLLRRGDGRWRGSIRGPWSSAQARGLAFSPDGTLLAEGTEWGGVRVWSVRWGTVEFTLLHPAVHGPDVDPEAESLATAVTSVSFSPDGRLLASTDLDGRVVVWNVHGRRVQWTRPVGPGQLARVAAFGPDGLLYAPGSVGVQVLAPDDGAVLRTLWLPVGSAPRVRDTIPAVVQSFILDLVLGGDGAVLVASGRSVEQAVGGGGEASTPWVAVQPLAEPGQPRLMWPPAAVVGLHVSPGGRWIAGRTATAAALVWEAATGREAYRIEPGLISGENVPLLHDAFFSPDGGWLYTIHSGPQPVVVWALTGGPPRGVRCHRPARRGPAREHQH
ncbi:MAG TPA: WD40 repeat domain-containing protein [Longimicrobium sp.]|nr:WD40 repeat domain-containing protein [Longimicrobium sp.]